VRVCKFGEVTIIVIASETGVEIYDDQGEHLLYSLRAKDRLELPEKGATLFCHGICSCNGEKSYVLVGRSTMSGLSLSVQLILILQIGTSVGKIFVMGRETGAKGEFEILETLQGHKEAISAIESTKTGSFVASGDDSGAILIRNPSDEFEILHRLTGEGYPLTSLRFTNDGWLVSGYLTGKIRVFKKHTFQVYADIAAHSRAVTALDVHDNFVVSVGEDTFMNIWEFTGSKSALRVKLVSSQCIPNDLLVGVAFDGMKKIYTAAYDTRHLKLWIPE
jgi:WD40 repeat protein